MQYPWEAHPQRHHDRVLSLPRLRMHQYPVTKAAYKSFLDATGWAPPRWDTQNWLRDWDWTGRGTEEASRQLCLFFVSGGDFSAGKFRGMSPPAQWWDFPVNLVCRSSPSQKADRRPAVPPGDEKQPVCWVSRDDAEAYCAHLAMRLPTSYEWQSV